MKVLLLTPYYPPLIGGAGTYLAGISRALIEAGNRVAVVSMQGKTGSYEHEGAPAGLTAVLGRIDPG